MTCAWRAEAGGEAGARKERMQHPSPGMPCEVSVAQEAAISERLLPARRLYAVKAHDRTDCAPGGGACNNGRHNRPIESSVPGWLS